MRWMILFLTVTAGWAAEPRPLLRDFIGLNGHTVQFKPDLYRAVTRQVRDYHGLQWDVGNDTSFVPTFPFARNRVNWEQLYASWQRAGHRIHVSLMFEQIPTNGWKNLPRDARAYGEAFARFFGPSGPHRLVESVEIGNEPSQYADADYRRVFEHMATGLRTGDPRLKIVTCATGTQPSGNYHKQVTVFTGLEPLYDVLSIHTYPFAEQWPTWRRSYPEDPSLDYLTNVQRLIDWRDTHAPGKPVWITEFGYDACTQPAPPTGDFQRWEDVTDEQQAQYIVRSFLVFSALNVQRAYLYWFNDDDKPGLHAASGLTRRYQPKPSFHAVAHLLATLGDYRFARVIQQTPGDLYLYEYRQNGQRLWVAWSPTGRGRTIEWTVPVGVRIARAEQMPLTGDTPPPVIVSATGRIRVGESPLYLWLADPGRIVTLPPRDHLSP